MAIISFFDGLGLLKDFDFSTIAGVNRFKINNYNQIEIQLLAQETLSTVGNSSVFNIADKASINFNLEASGITSSLSFNILVSNDNGVTYTPVYIFPIFWTTDRSEQFLLDNAKHCYTNVIIEIISLDPSSTLSIKASFS